MKYQTFVLVLGFSTAFVLGLLVRKARLHVSLMIWWFFIITAIVFLSLFPKTIDAIGQLVGVYYPPIIISILGFVVVFIKLVMVDMDATRKDIELRKTVQRLAILERELKDLKNLLERQSPSESEKTSQRKNLEL